MANAEGSIYRVENGIAVPYATLGGDGGEITYESNVDISSLVTPQNKLAITDAKMWRWGRITSLFITETFTEAWSTTVAAARCNIIDTTGKCLPNYDEMFHIGEAWAWQQAQAADYFGFVRGSVTLAQSRFTFFEMDFNGNSPISFALGDYIRFNMTFINRYEG